MSAKVLEDGMEKVDLGRLEPVKRWRVPRCRGYGASKTLLRMLSIWRWFQLKVVVQKCAIAGSMNPTNPKNKTWYRIC